MAAPMPPTGTIGAAASDAERRRTLPEPVVSFDLPVVARPLPDARPLPSGVVTGTGAQKDGVAVGSVKRALEELDLEASLTLVQSLRQSRLTHLTALLPFLSTRHRTATRYHAPPRGYPLPAELDPTKATHSQTHLARCDVAIGPLIFPRTRFGEASSATAPLPAPPHHPPFHPSQHPPHPPSHLATPHLAAPTPMGVARPVGPTSAARPTAPSAPAGPPTSAAAAPSGPAAAAAGSGSGAGAASGAGTGAGTGAAASGGAPAPAPAPRIDADLVQEVSRRAQSDPPLQRLLHIAANGRASNEELRQLAGVIARIGDEMKAAAGATGSAAGAPAPAPAAGPATATGQSATVTGPPLSQQAKGQAKGPASASTSASTSTTTSPVKAGPAAGTPGKGRGRPKDQTSTKGAKPPSGAGKGVKAAPEGAAAGAAGTNATTPATASDAVNAPPAQGSAPAASAPTPAAGSSSSSSNSNNSGVPASCPIITVEFRENPSARFILPLWRPATVIERRLSPQSNKRKMIKVTMWLPAIGSSAARAANAIARGGAAGDDEDDEVPAPAPGQQRDAPKGAERYPVTWTITPCADEDDHEGEGEHKEKEIPESLWDAFGRVNIGSLAEADNALVDAFLEKYRRAAPMFKTTPKLHVATPSKDLQDHLTDRFVPRLHSLSNRPVVRLKKGDDASAHAHAPPPPAQFVPVSHSSSSSLFSSNGNNKRALDDSVEAHARQAGDESPAAAKPKRKRHVATHNPDGTLKLCQACGTNTTPMWRRGPAGKSTLCNACGAKWKVGRLVVPDHPPTASTPALASASAPASNAVSTAELKPTTAKQATTPEKDTSQADSSRAD